MLDFTGRHIVIVGASSGIGAETAVHFGKDGAFLTLISRREEKLKGLVSSLEGKNHAYYCADISETEKINDLFSKIVSERGRIDGLVYAAGISADTPIRNLTKKRLQDVFNVNYFGFIECVKCVCKNGRYNDGLRVVAVSSIASIRGNKALTAYAASKAAMDASIRCIAKEMACKNICINSVAPSMIGTKMWEEYVMQNGEDNQLVSKVLERQYLGIGKPTDVASAIEFLMSPEARFITGIMLPVDGGSSTS